MRREVDQIKGTVSWGVDSEEIWAATIVAVVIAISLALAACRIAYTIYTPADVRLQFEIRASRS